MSSVGVTHVQGIVVGSRLPWRALPPFRAGGNLPTSSECGALLDAAAAHGRVMFQTLDVGFVDSKLSAPAGQGHVGPASRNTTAAWSGPHESKPLIRVLLALATSGCTVMVVEGAPARCGG